MPARVLIVDDSRTDRRMLRTRLEKRGYDVTEAADGHEAVAALRRTYFPVVVSDWMMPGLDGPGLCRAIRSEVRREDESYVYVLLLTSKQEKEDVSAGLSAGADDFLSKPVHDGELAARLKAGFRLVDIQTRQIAQKAELARAFAELKMLYDTVERDLSVASLLQRETVPPPMSEGAGFRLAALSQPAGHVGGDHVGYFQVGPHQIGAFSIDVSGHGVASAIMAVRLAQRLAPNDPSANIAITEAPDGTPCLRDPAEVIGALNALHNSSAEHDLYFTIAYAVLDSRTGHGRICRAGHAEPAILRADGQIEYLSNGGPPVGMIPVARFPSEPIVLRPGERLLLYSDGLTEATRPDGEMIGTHGLSRYLRALDGIAPDKVLPELVRQIAAEIAPEPFDDDISALMVERLS